MHSKNIPLFLIVASLTSTSLGLHHLVVTARRSFDILARQTTSGPCTSICNSIDSTLSSCTTSSCICTTAIEASVQACVNCAVGADPSDSSVITSAQNLIDSYEAVCSSVAGVPTVTIGANAGTAGTPNTATLPGTVLSTPIVPSTPIVSPTTVSQIVIGPTSAPTTALSVGSTSTSSIAGFPLKSSASPNKITLHWTVALLGLAAGNLLVF